ncbi:MAG: sulfatase-like hydrolase/transferase [Planctomycetota bacterium]
MTLHTRSTRRVLHDILPMCLLGFIGVLLAGCTSTDVAKDKPNILIIYTDDIGFADVSAYGGPISTPNIDVLARSGRRFTRSHAAAATCTPSRYALLTGKYPVRNTRAEILPGDAPLLIEPGSYTMPEHFASAGYSTAVIGKWHLGLGEGDVNWNGSIRPGPLEIGFTKSFLLPATNDRVPCVYLDGHTVVGRDDADPITVSYAGKVGDWPTGTENPEMLRYPGDPEHSGTIVNGISRIGWQHGGEAALWVDEEMTDVFTERAIAHIESREAADEPWFLFFSLHQPHVPRLPNQRFIGTSGHGLRGDAIVEADWSVGQLMDAINRLGISEDTIVVLSSDNGPVMDDGYADGALQNRGTHDPSGPYRGGKYTLWEGDTRVPFIMSWPGRVQTGVSDELFGQVDLMASLAALAGVPLNDTQLADLDTVDVSGTLTGGATTAERSHLVTQGVAGLAIQDDRWKYIPASDARRNFGRHWTVLKHIEPNNPLKSPAVNQQAYLFDLQADPGETSNVIAEHPEIAQRLDRALVDLLGDTPMPGRRGR